MVKNSAKAHNQAQGSAMAAINVVNKDVANAILSVVAMSAARPLSLAVLAYVVRTVVAGITVAMGPEDLNSPGM